jgi:hypothetical protein
MSKPRAAGILAALILGGLFLLSTLAVAAGDPLRGYFAKLEGAFRAGCREVASIDRDEQRIGEEAFLTTCLFTVRLLKPLTPPLVFNANSDDFQEALLVAFQKKVPGLGRRVTCDECVQTVLNFEQDLLANNTATDILDALVAGCEERFSDDPAKADECRQFVAPVSDLIPFVVTNVPPGIVCQQLNFCPLP